MRRKFLLPNQRTLGAAFLMATSAIGPVFLTQTAYFTGILTGSFGFVILVTIIIEIIAQVNIWRVIAITEMRAQDIANRVFPGAGYLLAFLVMLGGIAFSIGNIAGAGLGLYVFTGISTENGAIISTLIAISIFIIKKNGKLMDKFVQVMGGVILLLLIFIVCVAHPPCKEAIIKTFIPNKIGYLAIITIVGGTIGGYITFAGAHRLLASGIKGPNALTQVTQSAVMGIGIASIVRILLFLATLGVISQGITLNLSNPAASVFHHSAGTVGYIIFGIVLWAAAITSVIGAAYTSVSFILTFHRSFRDKQQQLIIAFIILCSIIFLIIGKPILLIILAGLINGLTLPIALILMLIAANKKSIISSYQYPKLLTITGFIVTLSLVYIGIKIIYA